MSRPMRTSGGRSSPGISFERFATGLRADFRFAPVNVLLLVVIFVAGLIVHLNVYAFSVVAVELALGSALVLAILLRLSQVWEAVVILGTADAAAIFLQLWLAILLVTLACGGAGEAAKWQLRRRP